MHKQFGFMHLGLVLLMLVLGGAAFTAWYVLHPRPKLDPTTLTKFVTADAVTLDNFMGVSLFRAAAGHNFTDSYETCRSLKHYFMPKNQADFHNLMQNEDRIPASIDHASSVPVYSPVNGTITKVESEQYPLGKQMHINVERDKEFTVRLFHVYPLDDMVVERAVEAGERIGSILDHQQMDIAVERRIQRSQQLVSYFDVMNDAVFASYQARGLRSRSDAIIPQSARDSQPLDCDGEQFDPPGDDSSDNWFYFDGARPPSESYTDQPN